MIIYNLGVDNTGKTTLSQKLLELDKSMLYIPPLGPLSRKIQIKVIENTLKIGHLDGINILYERYPLIDEMVYGSVLRGKSNFNMDEVLFRFWLQHMLITNHLIIYNRPSDDDIYTSIRQRKQMEGVADNILTLANRYDYVISRLKERGLNIITHDYTQKNDTEKILLKVGKSL